MSQRAERFPCFYGTKRGIENNKNILNTQKNILALTVDKLQFLKKALAQNFTISVSQEKSLSCMCHLVIIQADMFPYRLKEAFPSFMSGLIMSHIQ